MTKNRTGASPIHEPKAIWPIVEHLQTLGVRLHFQPHRAAVAQIKQAWMAFKHRTKTMLEADVCHIVHNFGSRYKLNF